MDLTTYNPSDFEAYLVDPEPTPIRPEVEAISSTSAGLVLRADASPLIERLEALAENDSKFKRSWQRKRNDLHDQTASSYCMSLACIAIGAGWTDQEIADLLIAWRRKHAEPLKPFDAWRDAKRQKATNWYQFTIDNARGMKADGRPENEAIAAATVNESVSEDAGGELGVLQKRLGIPITGVIKGGDDLATYWVKLEDGREIRIGNAAAMMVMDKFRQRIYDATGLVVPEMKRYQWFTLAALFTKIAEMVPMETRSPKARLAEWIRRYLDGTEYKDSNWADALPGNHPFVKEGTAYIHADSLRVHLRVSLMEMVTSEDVLDGLRELGFTGGRITGYVKSLKKPVGRYYHSAPLIRVIQETPYKEAKIENENEI